MKLDPDCIREILLAVENVCDMEHYFSSAEDMKKIHGQFTENEIFYHARQCELNGFFYKYGEMRGTYFEVQDLTPAGHNFLANIRSDTIWNGVKSVAEKIGSRSLDAVVQIASNVVSEIIKAQLGLT